MSARRRARREAERETARADDREARKVERARKLRWFVNVATDVLESVMPKRRAAAALQWIEGIISYLGGHDVTWASHKKIARRRLRSMRWSIRQKRAISELGIVRVTHHYRADKRRGADHPCALHCDPSEIRTNDYELDFATLERMAREIDAAAAAAPGLDPLPRAAAADENESTPSDGDEHQGDELEPNGDELAEAQRRADVAHVQTFLREHLPSIARMEDAAMLVKLGRGAGKDASKIVGSLRDVLSLERKGMPTPASELWSRAVKFVRAIPIDRTRSSSGPAPHGAASMRVERPEQPGVMMTPEASALAARAAMARIGRAPPD